MDRSDWKKFKGYVSKETWKELQQVAKDLEYHQKRVEKAKERLKKKPRRDLIMIVVDECRCATSDVAFHQKLFEDVFRRAREERWGQVGDPLDEDDEEIVFRGQPIEVNRKARIEKQLERELTWSEYWTYLETMYKEREDADEDRYEACTRTYGWDFDSGRDDGLFPSDLGMRHSDRVRVEEETKLTQEARAKELQKKRQQKRVPGTSRAK